MESFVFRYCLFREVRYLIWISDEKDHFLTLDNGLAPSFASLASLQSYAAKHDLALNFQSAALFDFDSLINWVSCPNTPPVCSEILDAWNSFGDVAASISAKNTSFSRLSEANKAIYDKLFWGCNLPAVTPKGERFDPEWNPQELQKLAEIMGSGLDLFQSFIYKND